MFQPRNLYLFASCFLGERMKFLQASTVSELSSTGIKTTVANRPVEEYFYRCGKKGTAEGLPSNWNELDEELNRRSIIEAHEFLSTFKDYFMDDKSVLIEVPNQEYEPSVDELCDQVFDVDNDNWFFNSVFVRDQETKKKYILSGLIPRDQNIRSFLFNSNHKLIQAMSDPSYEKFLADGHEVLAFNFPKRGLEIHELLHFMPEAFAKHKDFIKVEVPDEVQLEIKLDSLLNVELESFYRQRGRVYFRVGESPPRNNFLPDPRTVSEEEFQALVQRDVSLSELQNNLFGALFTQEENGITKRFMVCEKDGCVRHSGSIRGEKYQHATIDEFLNKYAKVFRENIDLVSDFIVEKNYFGTKLMKDIMDAIADETTKVEFFDLCVEKMIEKNPQEFLGTRNKIEELAKFVAESGLFGFGIEMKIQEFLEEKSNNQPVNFIGLCGKFSAEMEGRDFNWQV